MFREITVLKEVFSICQLSDGSATKIDNLFMRQVDPRGIAVSLGMLK